MCVKDKILLVSGLSVSGSVMAHTGDHGFSGLLHFLTEPDHMVIMLVIGVVTGLLAKKAVNHKQDLHK